MIGRMYYRLRTAISALCAILAACWLTVAHPSRPIPRAARPAAANAPFTLFETGQVRPLALSPDGALLFALNTPDGRLEIFSTRDPSGAPVRVASVPVGLEPVAVARDRPAKCGWSIICRTASASSTSAISRPRAWSAPYWWAMSRAIFVFAGPNTTALSSPPRIAAKIRRSIHSSPRRAWAARMSGCSTPTNLGAHAGGQPLTIITLFATRRARWPSRPTEHRLCGGVSFRQWHHHHFRGIHPSQRRLRRTPTVQGMPAPATGLIVKFRVRARRIPDALAGRSQSNWDAAVRLSLPDKDVFAINAAANPPAPDAGRGLHGVGTVLFNMAVNPVSGAIYVSNTDAQNDHRFEGPGQSSPDTACAATSPKVTSPCSAARGSAASSEQAHRLHATAATHRPTPRA